MFLCLFCHASLESSSKYIEHLKFHSNLTKDLLCGYNGCNKKFKRLNTLRVHLLRKHHRSREKLHKKISVGAANSRGKFICTVQICKKTLSNYKDFLKHLKNHIESSEAVECPFKGCVNTYYKIASFTSHISVKHKREQVDVGSGKELLDNEIGIDLDKGEHESEDFDDPDCFIRIEDNDAAMNEAVESEPDFEDLFLKNLMHFYLKLEAQFLIPVANIQHIVQELSNINSLNLEAKRKRLMSFLVRENISLDKANEAVNEIIMNDPFSKSNEILKSDYKRKKTYKNELNYVSPVEISLGEIEGKQRHFHYVPVIETVKTFFKNKSVTFELNSPTNSDSEVLSDFYDGLVYKNNSFFNDNEESLKLILYQDSFEIVNPIGPSRGKYKILAVYLSLGNLPYHLRTHINSIQLVAICREKFFSHAKIFLPIVEDLKKIEDGVEFFPNKTIKGGLVFIAGDNLGSHALGGFTENFSKSTYFCRFCLITRKEFDNNCKDSESTSISNVEVNSEDLEEESMEDYVNMNGDHDDREDSVSSADDETEQLDDVSDTDENDSCDTESEDNCEEECDSQSGLGKRDYIPYSYASRTIDSYKKALKTKKEKETHFEGIKFDSVFNRLKTFHVCKPGLPCCLAHDLFEGIVAYDFPLMITHFVENKWFSIGSLNFRIENFKYSRHDQRDKPSKVQEKSHKLMGGAWQIFIFLKLFPLLIMDYLPDFEDDIDEVWICLLRLIEIAEIACAPKIHKSCIPYLKKIIDEYLSLRMKLFPDVKLRPKHHFLTHYPELILHYGPLIKISTLRFESKHTYFKRVMRGLRCYKNVTHSLSEKHELHQALLRSGSGLANDMIINDEFKFDRARYSDLIQESVGKVKFFNTITECSSAIFKGTYYTKGQIVAIRQEEYQINVEMGQIILILWDEEHLRFILEVKKTTFRPLLRLYEIEGCIRYECIKAEQLLSYCPMDIYVKDSTSYVKIQNGLVSTPLCRPID